MNADLVLTNAKAYTPKGLVDCSIAIENGTILKIGQAVPMPKAEKRLDLGHLLVLPGLIDTHVHLRDEGKAYKEDFYSGTAAAAAGGITTVLDMPNNEPVTMSTQTLKDRMEVAEKKILVNVGFFSELPIRTEEIPRIVQQGCVSFKLFMGEQIGGLPVDNDAALAGAFCRLTESKIPLAVHAEDRAALKKTEEELKHAGRKDLDAFLKTHSEPVEATAVKRVIALVRQNHAQVHFCHVTTERSLSMIADARTAGMPVTCEVTPHHLFLSAEDLKRIGTIALTLPPVRDRNDNFALLRGLRQGSVDSVASDHAPHALKEKRTESIWDVKGGIPGLETTLPLLLTQVNRGLLSICDVVRLMSTRPAEIFAMKRVGSLTEGNQADLTVVDLSEKFKVDTATFHSKAEYSPFDGWPVQGKAVKTFVRGQLIMDEGEIVAKAGSGSIIRREFS